MNKLAEAVRLPDEGEMASHTLDAMSAAPQHHDVLFENERVRILDTKVVPGDRTPLHAHEWGAALYILSWSDFIRRAEDGAVLADSRGKSPPPLGSGMWIDPLPPHSVENVGSTDLHIIAVEVKA